VQQAQLTLQVPNSSTVSGIARHLLSLLRRRSAIAATEGDVHRGASARQLAALPSTCCAEVSGADDLCPICLAPFATGEALCALECRHQHHHTCLVDWLRVRACCPICKLPLEAVATTPSLESPVPAVGGPV